MKTETRILHIPSGDTDWLDALRGTGGVDCAVTEPLFNGELGRIDSGFTIRVVDEMPRSIPVIAPMVVKPCANIRPYLKKKKGRQ